MKICFFLHRRFTALGHNIALHLKEKYAVEKFCAYVAERNSFDFLKSQNDIRYTQLILNEDIHKRYVHEPLDRKYLRSLERDYGIPNLWAYIVVDRVLMHNHLVREYPYDQSPYHFDELRRILQVTAKAIIAFLEEEKPDVLCTTQALGGLGNLLLYHIAKKKKIQTWTISQTGIKDKWVLSSHHIRLLPIEHKFKEKFRTGLKDTHYEQAKKIVEEFRRQPEPYYKKLQPSEQAVNRISQLRFLSPLNLYRSVFFFGKLIYRYFTNEERSDYTYVTPWHYVLDHIKRKVRNLIGNNDLYDTVSTTENFAFFPLQAEPEASSVVGAPFKTNQIEAIKQIAQSLPIDYLLYVKEHPMMAQYRPRSYYKELKKIRNVKLINPTVDGFHLLAHAKLLITITGTLGFQATFFKKPTITLGNVYYNCLSFVAYCPEMEKLPYVIKTQLENSHYDEEELLAFVATILEESVTLNYIHLWEEASDMGEKKRGIEPLADLLASKLNLRRA